jgi:hypothetical protein
MPKTLLLLILLLPELVAAQLPGSCGPGAATSISCADACVVCEFNGYTGSTAGFPSGVVPTFCGTVENVQWIGFIAGAANATFTITPTNCLNGDGVQVALYADCLGAPLACDIGEMGGGSVPASIEQALVPGYNYFLLIDGYAGDWCDFTVTVDPPGAVYQPPIGAAGTVIGPAALCPGAEATFSTQVIPGAGAYVWNGPPGSLINGEPVPATVVGLDGTVVTVTMGTQGGPICVQGINSCQSTAPCSAGLNVELLDDSHRPALAIDTVAHVNCLDATAQLEAHVAVPGAYAYAWTADSAGTIMSDTSLSAIRVGAEASYAVEVRNLQNGCSATATVVVTGPDYPDHPVFDHHNSTCYGFDDAHVVVTDMIDGAPPFLYTLSGAANPYGEFYDLAPGDYTLLIRSGDGCEWDTVLTITEPAELLVELGPDTLVGLGHELALWQTAGMVNFPDRVAALLATPTGLQPMLCDTCRYWPTGSFHYTVTVRDSNGCEAADERMVLVDQTRRVYIPTAFAPESTGGNDRFRLFAGADVALVRSFRVFNRWGNLVYGRDNLAPGEPDWGWDGRLNGRLLDPAVFIYAAEVEFLDGGREEYRGEVVLIR